VQRSHSGLTGTFVSLAPTAADAAGLIQFEDTSATLLDGRLFYRLAHD
jgi:hypothetical protein